MGRFSRFFLKGSALCLLWSFLLLPLVSVSQTTLTITIQKVSSSKGNIRVGLFNEAASFRKPEKAFKGLYLPAQKGTITAVIKDVPEGTYAVAVFHDENANLKLDTNFFGIPKEALGFSKGKLKAFGPPDFQECSFEFPAENLLSITIK